MELNNKLLKDIYDCQIYLLDLGVSFEYTDNIDAQSRRDLIKFIHNWKEEHKPQVNL